MNLIAYYVFNFIYFRRHSLPRTWVEPSVCGSVCPYWLSLKSSSFLLSFVRTAYMCGDTNKGNPSRSKNENKDKMAMPLEKKRILQMKKDTKRVGIPTGIIKQHAEKMFMCSIFCVCFFLRKKKIYNVFVICS